jgi:hypothetical protein
MISITFAKVCWDASSAPPRIYLRPMTALTYGNGSRKEMTYDARYRVQTNRMLGVVGSLIALYGY